MISASSLSTIAQNDLVAVDSTRDEKNEYNPTVEQ